MAPGTRCFEMFGFGLDRWARTLEHALGFAVQIKPSPAFDQENSSGPAKSISGFRDGLSLDRSYVPMTFELRAFPAVRPRTREWPDSRVRPLPARYELAMITHVKRLVDRAPRA